MDLFVVSLPADFANKGNQVARLTNYSTKTNKVKTMKNRKIYYYVFKWFALIILSVILLKDNHSKIAMALLIGFVGALLIWEGIKDYVINRKKPEKIE
jgi:hypothetical protein